MLYWITWRRELQRPAELVEADSLRRDGSGHLVLLRIVIVIFDPREIVVRRLRVADVVQVEPLTDAQGLAG